MVLEGLEQVKKDHLFNAIDSSDSRVRLAAIKVVSVASPEDLIELCEKNKGDEDPRVAEQMLYSLGTLDLGERLSLMEAIAAKHIHDRGVMLATLIGLWGMNELSLVKNIKSGSAFSNLDPAEQSSIDGLESVDGKLESRLEVLQSMSTTERKRIEGGERLFYKHCATCHGSRWQRKHGSWDRLGDGSCIDGI